MSETAAPPKAPCAIKLRNHLDGSILLDILHARACHPSDCSSQYCCGSIVRVENSESAGDRGNSMVEVREILVKEAEEFIAEYYTSLKRNGSPAHCSRQEEVRNSIVTTGTYHLKETELIFGARTAWRNTSRCIGRMYWNHLQVFDARNVRTAGEMFESICSHLRYATNEGNVRTNLCTGFVRPFFFCKRSAITLFPARSIAAHDYRIWNSQIISYAGYETKNGVLGDPANTSLTQICVDFGWHPPGGVYGKFDILPLILQAAEEEPVVMEIPKECIMEIPITHPELSWFGDLGLKWYAVPMISNMALRIGGLVFPAAPFNGWYMDTEIACRDFCDEHRYNILPDVAARLGLDCSQNSSLWRERAQTEVNSAVLHSFQKNGITIIDHHTACDLFLSHLRNETILRGGCPSDWVWIIPPSAPNTNVLFHQEMLNYQLKPAYGYQEDAWRTDDHIKSLRTKALEQGGRIVPPALRRQFTFKGLTRSLIVALRVMRQCLVRRTGVLILYGTQTGRSRRFAARLAQLFRQAFNVRLACMDEYDANELRFETIVLLVTSTFGNGDPPANGEEFSLQLFDIKMKTVAAAEKNRKRAVSFNSQPTEFSILSEEPPSDKAFRERIRDSSLANVSPGELDNVVFPAQRLTFYPAETSENVAITAATPPRDSNGDSGVTTPCRNSLDSTPSPEEKRRFRSMLSAPAKSFRHHIDSKYPLKDVQFAVFGLGSTAYPKFAAFAGYVNNILGDLGGERLLLLQTGDELSVQEKAFQNWQKEVFQVCMGRYSGVQKRSLALGQLKPSLLWSPRQYRGTPIKRSLSVLEHRLSSAIETGGDILAGLSSLHHKNVQAAKVIEIKQLLPVEAGREIVLVRMDVAHCQGMDYQPGDHVMVFPANPQEQVDIVLQHCLWDLGEISDDLVSPFDTVVELETKHSHNDDLAWSGGNRFQLPCSCRMALTNYLDITQAPSQWFLCELANASEKKTGEEYERLLALSSNSLVYAAWLHKRYPTMADVFEEFKEILCPVSLLLTQLPRLEPRYYSVSSSLNFSPQELHITADIVCHSIDAATGERRLGLCSLYWTSVRPGSLVHCSIRSAHTFHLPAPIETPLVFVGTGTGIAPFRSFWQHVSTIEGSLRKTYDIVLYFGCHRHDVDDFYANELEQAVLDLAIRKVYKAFSREPNQSRVYVQDLLSADGADVYRQLITMCGHLYVCGDVRMAADVQRTIVSIFCKEAALCEVDAKELVMKMTEENRYHEDVFGLTMDESRTDGVNLEEPGKVTPAG